MVDIPRFRSGQPLRAGDLNALADALRQAAKLRGDGRFVHVNESPAGKTVGLDLDTLWAELPKVDARDLRFGKATAAWTTGNSITLDPCDEDGNDNGRANVTAYIVCPTDKAITYAEIAADDVIGYLPYGDHKGIVVTCLYGGTATSVDDLLPTAANWEVSEAAQTDTWDRANQGVTDGVKFRVQMRTVYDDTSDETLYGYYREFVFDSNGQLKTISAETRVTIDAPEECP